MARGRTKSPEQAPPLDTYGINLQFPRGQIDYDRSAFALRRTVDQGAPVRSQLFRQMADRLLPGYFQWHSWTKKKIEVLTDNDTKQTHLVGMPGCAGSSKTHDVAGYAVAWWLAWPNESSVMFVSTTIKSLKKRGWAEIRKCYTMIPGPRFGNFVDSKMSWQCQKGDDKHAIFGKAVEEGNTSKVADDIKGVHTKRQMVIIDEANTIPEAIWDACTNLYSTPREFVLIALANPRSRLERFARFIEPKDGWQSVTVDTDEWEGKPQVDYGNAIVQVVRFDAEKSPNITEGRLVSEYLPTKERVEAARQASGGGHTPNYFTNERGFPPPEGMTKTVFTESALSTNDANGTLIFTGERVTIIGMFDLAFGGGDRPAVRFAKLGMVDGNRWGIQMFPPIIVPVNVHSTNPVDYQLVECAKRLCEKFEHKGQVYSCQPENFAFDATGRGGAVVSIAQRTWSPRVIGIDFGGAASEDSVSLEDIRPANEVYRNKRAEMYFRSRNALDHGQLKGIDPDTAQELCNMEFEDISADGRSKPIVLMAKKDYKEKFRKSPDYADCAVGLLEVARRKGFRLAPMQHTKTRFQETNDMVKKAQAVYEDISYAEQDVEELFAEQLT